MAYTDQHNEHKTMGAIFEDLKLASGALVSAYVRAAANEVVSGRPPASYAKYFLLGFSTLGSFMAMYEVFRQIISWVVESSWDDIDPRFALLLTHGLLAVFFLAVTVLILTHQYKSKSSA